MKIAFTPDGWKDFTEWIETDRKKLNRLLRLIKECSRSPFTGLGEPEPLKHDWAGWWSRRIDQEHRLVYRVTTRDGEQVLEIAQCRYHY
jgi:toxin YoeB